MSLYLDSTPIFVYSVIKYLFSDISLHFSSGIRKDELSSSEVA